ncbi:MAG: RNA polymerase sigma factor [Pirellulales bacterium]
MSETADVDLLLVDRISQGDSQAWEELISRYEGRLLAFVETRIKNRAGAEDIVQECFIGFLNSLPNYDRRRPLEGYLFSICAYKLTDHLRREGRRPAIAMSQTADSSSDAAWQVPAENARGASSIARSGERRGLEEQAIVTALREQINKWRERGDWLKLQCIELLFVAGLNNKDVAKLLDISEQQVANFKFDFIARTKSLIGRQELCAEVFPELE